MCGIIGYIGSDNTLERLIEGLRALEYRGYDSAGVAFFDREGSLRQIKAAGRLTCVESKLRGEGFGAVPVAGGGIGHTRWATHGSPSDVNSHPHGTARLQLVHNGIIENYAALRAELEAQGYTFISQTDTEAAAKLLDYFYIRCRSQKLPALERLCARLRGSWALGIVFADDPNHLYALRKDSPLIIGAGGDGNTIASDITAILGHTRQYYDLEEGEIAILSADSVRIIRDGREIKKPLLTAHWDVEAAERGGFPHFMLKEIHEEPDAVRKTLSGRIADGLPDFSGDGIGHRLASAGRLTVVACGTAMHAGLIAGEAFEKLARLPTDIRIASEFRCSDPLIDSRDAVLIISQSGETADSLAALRLAKARGAHTIAVVNVIGSTIAREADSVLYTWAGPEIAVASTKAYSVQTALLWLLACDTARKRGFLSEDAARALTAALRDEIPEAIRQVIARKEEIHRLARSIALCKDLFFIGRGTDYLLAEEGSLKLKEVSYIHSEAYPAGELKHGTISLITDGIPVIALCTVSALADKMASGIREVAARGAEIIALCASGTAAEADQSFVLPPCDPRLAFLPAAAFLQLLAYYTAVERGCDVDKPRNLAKSVTVE